jgi:hypothetical protein
LVKAAVPIIPTDGRFSPNPTATILVNDFEA